MALFHSALARLLGLPVSGGQPLGRPAQVPDATLAYGAHPLQQLDWFSAGKGLRPLVAFLHGGAWQFGDKARRLKDRKVEFCRAESWHFASLNFRMVPEVTPAEMAEDVAAALALLWREAEVLEIDPARVVLMGHSSGAHLAALAGTDPSYLESHGLSPAGLTGVIAVDGPAYDATLPSAMSRWVQRRLVDPALPPHDTTALKRLSPALNAAQGGNAKAWLVLHAARSAGMRQATALEAALREAGTPVERHGFAGSGAHAHVMLSRKFGAPGYPATEVARGWLRQVFS